MNEQIDTDLFIASLTVAEIRRGILEKPAGRKRQQLEACIGALDDYWSRLTKAYGGTAIIDAVAFQLNGIALKNLKSYEVDGLDAMVTKVMAALAKEQS